MFLKLVMVARNSFVERKLNVLFVALTYSPVGKMERGISVIAEEFR